MLDTSVTLIFGSLGEIQTLVALLDLLLASHCHQVCDLDHIFVVTDFTYAPRLHKKDGKNLTKRYVR